MIFSNVALAQGKRPSQEIKLTYTAFWGGFVISKVYSTAIITETDYRMEVSYKVTGLASIFSNMQNTVSVQGKFGPEGGLKPTLFENQGTWSRYSFKNRTEFQKQDSKIVSHDFEFKFKDEAKYIPVREDLQYGPDMLSFYLGLTLDEEVMSIGTEVRHQNVFGGFFLMDIGYQCIENKELKSKRSIYRGETLICEFTDKHVDGGFQRIKKKKKSKRKKKKKKNTDTMEPVPLQIWYAKVGDLKNMIPVYTEFPIGWGKVRVYLSEIEVTEK